METGIDSNKNGILESSEISNKQNVCNGATGATGLNSLVKLTQEAAGTNCLTGGVAISSGIDTSNNGILETGKICSTMYVCNGAVSSDNTAPVANAGTAQNVNTGAVVTLDGSGSSDANSDLLTYSWSLTSKPSGSTATLSSATAVKPSFTADIAGTYIFNLVVNDGKVNSSMASSVYVIATSNIVKLKIRG